MSFGQFGRFVAPPPFQTSEPTFRRFSAPGESGISLRCIQTRRRRGWSRIPRRPHGPVRDRGSPRSRSAARQPPRCGYPASRNRLAAVGSRQRVSATQAPGTGPNRAGADWMVLGDRDGGLPEIDANPHHPIHRGCEDGGVAGPSYGDVSRFMASFSLFQRLRSSSSRRSVKDRLQPSPDIVNCIASPTTLPRSESILQWLGTVGSTAIWILSAS
jgi:hypothetical protein